MKEKKNQEIAPELMKHLLAAQQGEEDAVLMYQRLAKKVRGKKDRAAFERLAKDEKRHSDVFKVYTKQDVRPKLTKAIMVPLMLRLLGRKRVYPIIANAEYKAADKYKGLVKIFPEVERVMNDETHHGDAVMGLLEK